MTGRPLNRRTFVTSAATSLLAAPFLRSTLAEGAPPPKRFIVVWTPLGTIYDHWRPMGNETNFSLPFITAPLEPHKKDLIFVDGLDHQLAKDNGTCDHTAASSFLTGRVRVDSNCTSFSHGQSLDLFIANRIGADRPVKHLALAVTNGGDVEGVPSHFFVSQSAANGQVTPYTIPGVAFDRLFGQMLLGQEQARKVRQARMSTLDVLNAELKALKGRIGQEEGDKLDAHLDSFRELERRFTTDVGGGQCKPQAVDPSIPRQPGNAFPSKIPEATRAQIDTLTMALACDLTRVATLNIFQVAMTCSWTGSKSNHHELSHGRGTDPNPLQSFMNDKRWLHEMYAYLLTRLKSIPEGNGTMLDNTLVLFATEMGEPSLHNYGYLPLMLAGKAGGAVRAGRHLRYGGAANRPAGLSPEQIPFSGVPHNRLLLTICKAFGLSDVNSWGEGGYNAGGVLPGILA